MDFQTLTRRELQSLCKLNKIPANLTNVAMAEALQSLHTVVGIEEYVNVTQSETADVVQSVDVLSPQTRCRTSTVTRTTRRGGKQPPKEVEESKNDSLKTPAVSRTTRKVSATSTRRNVSHQLSECETEVLVENKYSTRRSTRFTEKKATVRKGAVKIDSILDRGNSNAEVEDICNAFEKLDVVVIEEEVKNVKQDSEVVVSASSDHKEDTLKNSEVKDEVVILKQQDLEENLNNSESDEVTTQTEVKEVEFRDDLKEHTSNNVSLESAVDADSEMINQVSETHDSSMAVIVNNTENQIDELITKELEEVSENTVVETEEVGDLKSDLFTQNNMTPIKKATPFKSVIEDQRFEVFTENNENSGLAQNQVTGNPGHVTPFKNTSGVVSDDKENNNVVEVKDIIKKDENDKIKNANDMSIRQLKKLLKAMTLDSHNSKEEGGAVGTKRTALQAVCENQMVVSSGDNEN